MLHDIPMQLAHSRQGMEVMFITVIAQMIKLHHKCSERKLPLIRSSIYESLRMYIFINSRTKKQFPRFINETV